MVFYARLVNIKSNITFQEHPDIRHTVDQATTRITLACIRRFTVRHPRRIPTCTEDMLLPPRILRITTRRSRTPRRRIPTIPSCRRTRILICPASLNHLHSREVTGSRVILMVAKRKKSRREDSEAVTVVVPKLNRLKL